MNNALMSPRNNKRNKAGRAIAQSILDECHPSSVKEIQASLKIIFGPMFEAMLQGEMDSHLGYESNDHGQKSTDNRRNDYVSNPPSHKFWD
jgi:transposase-like protein